MVHYDKKAFPERYRNGVFIAFHGSWNRAPYPQGGYNVVFQPHGGRPRIRRVRNLCGWFCGSGEIAGQSRRIVRMGSRLDQTARSTFPTMCADESTELFIAAALATVLRV